MKNSLLLLIFIVPVYSVAQHHETFDDNHNGWAIGKSDDHSTKIESGKLILTTRKQGSGRYCSMPWYFDKDKDFVLEASFVQQSGSDDNGFGLYWGRDGDHKSEFVIASNGYFQVGDAETNQWEKTKLVKPLKQTNTLRVEKKGRQVTYILNGKKIAAGEAPMYGYGVGYHNYTNMVLEIDDFKFTQDNSFKIVEDMPKVLQKENLGPAVNTSISETGPIISTDGRTLYFHRKYYEYNIGGKDDGEDMWISSRKGDSWGKATNLGRPVNSEKVDNLASVSSDNNVLIFSKGNTEGKFVYRKMTEDNWSDEIDIGLNFINESKYIESQMAADGKAILFTAKNSANVNYQKDIDEKDIYVSLQDKEGKWSEPINLGKDINTSRNEISPFLAADGRTLYFASEGRPGFGSSDIFVAKRLGNGWTKWTEPLNLGSQINTTDWDAYYTIPASGEFAYMVSYQNSIGEADIFRLKLPPQAKPDPVILILGKTINAKTKEPVAAEIILDNLTTHEEVAEAISNSKSGEFRIVLPTGANYGVHAAAKGYLSVNENMELATIAEYAEVQKDLFLVPLALGETLQLNNVFFEQGKPILKAESFPELDRLATILLDNPKVHIELAGHTDNVGPAQSLMKLSQERVDAVKKYLETKGIDGRRITGRGFGSTQPIEKNDTEEHKKKNRRVEFKITKN